MNRPLPAASARRRQQRGVALVITLIMLSVVTITAVAFLAVSRRERLAVTAFGEQIDARNLADAALNRARAEMAARIAATTNRFAYGFAVSTNYQNPQALASSQRSYPTTRNFGHLTNVSYTKGTDSTTFDFDLDDPIDRRNYASLLGNLFYDPRPPVVVQTNVNPRLPWDFRFFLDLNRNGRFETNGLVTATDNDGNTEDAAGNPYGLQYQVGDPEWIGLLEHPDAPHSGVNRFVGRFAYLILPAGRALDLNFLGNDAKRLSVGDALPAPDQLTVPSGYLRNQGVGSWELNAAAFFRDLNTNAWPRLAGYLYRTNVGIGSQFVAFADAERLLRYRRNQQAPEDAENFFSLEAADPDDGVLSAQTFQNDRIDNLSDGPVFASLSDTFSPWVDDDQSDRPAWSGSDEARRFTDINQLFDPTLALGGRVTGQQLLAFAPGTQGANWRERHTNSTYNLYTFYRALAQLGTDSSDARFESGFHPAYRTAANPSGFYRRAKLNLNYAHEPHGDRAANASLAGKDGFTRWTPLQWFTNAADRLLLSEFTNGLAVARFQGDDRPMGFPVYGRPPLGDPTFPLYQFNDGTVTNHVYDGQVHRLLQFAANIYEATHAPRTNLLGTTRYADPRFNFELFTPNVFRPRFYEDSRSPGVLRIAGYVPVTPNGVAGAANLLGVPWFTPEEARARNLVRVGDADDSRIANIVGIPWVIGARKGLPSFNEAIWQTGMQFTRRLRVRKAAPNVFLASSNSLPFGGGFITEAQYQLILTNAIGVEAWNSYNFRFPVPVRVYVTNSHQFQLYVRTGNNTSNVVWSTPALGFVRNIPVAANDWFNAGDAQGRDYVAALRTNLVYQLVYDPLTLQAYPANLTNVNPNLGYHNVANVRPPDLGIVVSNRMTFAIFTDTGSPRPGQFLDLVTLSSVMNETNLLRYLGAQSGGPTVPIPGLIGAGTGSSMPDFWRTNAVPVGSTLGIRNQMLASVGQLPVDTTLWSDRVGVAAGVRPPPGFTPKDWSILGLSYFLYGTTPFVSNDPRAEELRRQFGGTTNQVGFNPSPGIYLTDRRQANDPLVHYTSDDLQPGYSLVTDPGQYTELGVREGRVLGNGVVVSPFGQVLGQVSAFRGTTNDIVIEVGTGIPFAQRRIREYSPWGADGRRPFAVAPPLGGPNSTAFDLAYKDPQVTASDDWRFLSQPTNFTTIPATQREHFPLPNIGWLGRVHRGTPWQTAFLKSRVADAGPMLGRYSGAKNWAAWSGNYATHPTGDWKFLDLFTTAVNDNAARGLLAVNQTNLAAWSAVVSGVPVLDNRANPEDPQPLFLAPDSDEVRQILTGYTAGDGTVVPGLLAVVTSTNALAPGFPAVPIAPGGTFTNLGSVLSVPTLSDRAPFLAPALGSRNVTDEVVERLPQQILSLLRADEPRMVVYAWGQSLKPAPNSMFLRPGPLYGMITNYVVTGEFATKSVLRLDGPPNRLSPVVEDHRILYENP